MEKEMKIKIAKELATEVSRKLKEKVSVTTVSKNNGVERIGLNLSFQKQHVCPIIYLDEYFKLIENRSITIQQITEEILDVFKKRMHSEETDMIDFILNKEYILRNIYYSVVNKERNQHLLQNCPHCEVLDLAVLFRCCIKNSSSRSSFLIYNNHMEIFGVSIKDLYDAAYKNTLKLFGCDIDNLSSLIKDMGGDIIDVSLKDDPIVVSNHDKMEGASLIMYSQIFENLSQKLNADLYILPSSIHELIILKADAAEANELKEIVHSVNMTLDKEDFLSDSIYRYDKDSGLIIIPS